MLLGITSFPQLYQIIKTEKVRDINPYFFVLHVLSDVLYLSYGILSKDTLLHISMSLPSACNAIIFGLCLYYREDENDAICLKNDKLIEMDESN